MYMQEVTIKCIFLIDRVWIIVSILLIYEVAQGNEMPGNITNWIFMGAVCLLLKELALFIKKIFLLILFSLIMFLPPPPMI